MLIVADHGQRECSWSLLSLSERRDQRQRHWELDCLSAIHHTSWDFDFLQSRIGRVDPNA